MSADPRPKLDPDLSRALHRIDHRPLWRIALFAAIWATASAAAIATVAALGGAWWTYLACLPLYVLAGAALHGISLFTHEGVHGVLNRHAGLNHAISLACALPVLQTHTAYRVLHLRHHKYLGADGDPDHYPNYTEWTPMIWAMHWGRLVIGYPAYLVAIPVLGFRQGNARDRLWIAAEVLLLAGWLALLWRAPWPLLLQAWLLPMVAINTMVNIRGMSQHTLLEHATDVVHGSRTLLTSRLVAFFMCNENYHLEHHLYPAVPWHQLPRLHAALREQLIARGAPYTRSYSAFVYDFARASLGRRSVGTVSVDAVNPVDPVQ
jgi:fatty acid desaturase